MRKSLALCLISLAACADNGNEQFAHNHGGVIDGKLQSHIPDGFVPGANVAPVGAIDLPSDPRFFVNGIEGARLSIREVADARTGHSRPTDLKFNPERPNELWVVNQGDSSVWIATNPGKSTQAAVWRQENTTGRHFLARPSALSFGENSMMATAQDEDRITQSMTPAEFMGPTMWSTQLEIFNGGHEGHTDMLYNSPSGKGIAWHEGNAYWYFDGYHNSITHYDFRDDHGPGGTDHRDGVVRRYVEGEVASVRNVASHMVYHHESGQLFIADSGNNRIAVFTSEGAKEVGDIHPNYDGTVQKQMVGGSITTLVDGNDVGMVRPSGLAIYDGAIYVTDNATSRFFVFNMAGKRLTSINTGLPEGSLMGLTFNEDGQMFFVDAVGNRVLMLVVE